MYGGNVEVKVVDLLVNLYFVLVVIFGLVFDGMKIKVVLLLEMIVDLI